MKGLTALQQGLVCERCMRQLAGLRLQLGLLDHNPEPHPTLSHHLICIPFPLLPCRNPS
jgi:hypothetical protein